MTDTVKAETSKKRAHDAIDEAVKTETSKKRAHDAIYVNDTDDTADNDTDDGADNDTDDGADDAEDGAEDGADDAEDGSYWCPIEYKMRAPLTDQERHDRACTNMFLHHDIPEALRKRVRAMSRTDGTYASYRDLATYMLHRVRGESHTYTDDKPIRSFWNKLIAAIWNAVFDEADKEQANGDGNAMTEVLHKAREVIEYDNIRSPKDAFDAAYESGALARPASRKATHNHFDLHKAYSKLWLHECNMQGDGVDNRPGLGECPPEDAPMFGMHAKWMSHKLPVDMFADALRLIPAVMLYSRTLPIDKSEVMLNELTLDPPAYEGDTLGWWHAALQHYVYGRGPNP